MEQEHLRELSYNLINMECNYTSNYLNAEGVSTDLGCNATGSTAIVGDGNIGKSQEMFILFMELLKAMNIRALKAVTTLIYATGIIANILLLGYIVKFKRYRSPTFVIIFSLACCDLGTCAGGCFLSMLIVPVMDGPGWFCPLFIYIISAFYLCSVFHMEYFSILRFYQLVFPLAAHARVTVSFVSKICAFIWPISMLGILYCYTYYIPVAFLYEQSTILLCDVDPQLKERPLITQTIVLLLPNVTIFSFHLLKHIIVRRQAKKSASGSDQQTGSRQITDARAVTVVILAFCLTSMPHLLHTFLHTIFGLPIPSFHLILEAISLNLVYLNSALNPYIYVFCARSVRRDVFNMFTCKKRL